MDYHEAKDIIRLWAKDKLEAVRFSGGEPTLWPYLAKLCRFAQLSGITYIAVSTNGSAKLELYKHLILNGVNDFSISLDACCAEDGDKMAGGVKGAWDTTVANIKALAKMTYVTVGVVLTEQNAPKINDIVVFADSLGVSDIRIIPAAQVSNTLSNLDIDPELLAKYPILLYRFRNLCLGRNVRGIGTYDSYRCGLALDDMAVNKGLHFPCIIYLREGGKPIGKVGPEMRAERKRWFEQHDTHMDPICSKNCLDVCVDYNNKFMELNPCSKDLNLVSSIGSSGESELPSMSSGCGAEPTTSSLTQLSSKPLR